MYIDQTWNYINLIEVPDIEYIRTVTVIVYLNHRLIFPELKSTTVEIDTGFYIINFRKYKNNFLVCIKFRISVIYLYSYHQILPVDRLIVTYHEILPLLALDILQSTVFQLSGQVQILPFGSVGTRFDTIAKFYVTDMAEQKIQSTIVIGKFDQHESAMFYDLGHTTLAMNNGYHISVCSVLGLQYRVQKDMQVNQERFGTRMRTGIVVNCALVQ